MDKVQLQIQIDKQAGYIKNLEKMVRDGENNKRRCEKDIREITSKKRDANAQIEESLGDVNARLQGFPSNCNAIKSIQNDMKRILKNKSANEMLANLDRARERAVRELSNIEAELKNNGNRLADARNYYNNLVSQMKAMG